LSNLDSSSFLKKPIIIVVFSTYEKNYKHELNLLNKKPIITIVFSIILAIRRTKS